MRYDAIVLWMMLFGSAPPAAAQVSIGIEVPGVSIGINLPLYPELVQVPDYPVYYAPQVDSNYFFYDGMYWVYQSDNWYASSWYNGPWGLVDRDVVPLFVLRVPVRYYRAPPGYFRGWRADAPPRWGDHWGNDWQQRRSGWDRWSRNAVPAPAPLPVYQRQFSGDRYPRSEQQRTLQTQNYRYQPREAAVRQHYQERAAQKPPAPSRPESRPQDNQRAALPQSPQKSSEDMSRPPQQKAPAARDQQQLPRQGADPREQQKGRSGQEPAPQGKGASQEPRRDQGQGKDREKGEERGQDRNK